MKEEGGYLATGDKAQCFGCEACAQACVRGAIKMLADEEGFRYPEIDEAQCVHCGQCRRVCPVVHPPKRNPPPMSVFGGYVLDEAVREESTSGGFFSALADAWCKDDTLVFGAIANGLAVRHCGVKHRDGIAPFRKSKYLQSEMGDCYRQVKAALAGGTRVLFSGTPCQIAGLKTFLVAADHPNLLTVEVVCEGVPTPHYIQKFASWLGERLGGTVQTIDYRFKDGHRWDFEALLASLQNPNGGIFKWKQDRWFNPFWSIWLQHLISRPSCYQCPFAAPERLADVTLGDLWGVHLYCPELYGHNGGASLAFCNTEKGLEAIKDAQPRLYGHFLPLETALRYQGPMRGHIAENPCREKCMADLRNMPFAAFTRKWAKKPGLRLLFSKYVWGNRQKVWLWNRVARRVPGAQSVNEGENVPQTEMERKGTAVSK